MASATDYIISLMKQGSENRVLNLYFPRDDGPDAGLLVHKLHAFEPVSADFIYTVTAISDDATIELKDVLCKMVCVELLRGQRESRYFNGYCHEFTLQRVENGLAVYQMVLKPWLAFFTLRKDYHIFQNQNIEQQTKEMFLEMGITSADFRIHESDPIQTFSVQYDETDYNYLHRQWERMGWHYYYEHTLKGHKLILCSTSRVCDPVDGNPDIPWHHDGGSNAVDKIGRFAPVRQVVSGKVTLSNFDFKSPIPQRISETSDMDQGDAIHRVEVYEYEGLYGYKNEVDGSNIARRRMEQIESEGKQFAASGDHRSVQPGRWFRLTKDYIGQMFGGSANDNEFFILSATHTITNNYLSSEGKHASYSNELTCIRRKIPWRPERGFNSKETLVPGIDTATVVGPKGEEIHTDKYGRIKVQFHWDRRGKNDTNSSCWIRVMTPWADNNFGMVALPRVGTEVVIQYLQGNPDRPLVVGQLYNQSHMPPWDLPANKTQSGILTRSSNGGSSANANALRFEDAAGREEVWLHAEKDQRIEVENDESHWVGHDRKKTIDHDETTLVKHDRTETVDHDETITIHNDRTEVVDHNEKITIHNDRTEVVDHNETITVHNDRTEVVDHDETITIHNDRTEVVDHNEKITIHNDRTEVVDHNETITVHNDRTETVDHDEKITIHNDRTERVDKNEKISIGNNRQEDVGKDETVKIGKNQTLNVGANRAKTVGEDENVDIGKDWSIHVGKVKTETIGLASVQNVGMGRMDNVGVGYNLNVAMVMTTIVGLHQFTKVGKTISTSAQDQIEFSCGAAKIVLKKDGGIFLKGTHIEIQGSDAINMDSPSIDINSGKSKGPDEAAPAKQDKPTKAADAVADATKKAQSAFSKFVEFVKSVKTVVDEARKVAATIDAIKKAIKEHKLDEVAKQLGELGNELDALPAELKDVENVLTDQVRAEKKADAKKEDAKKEDKPKDTAPKDGIFGLIHDVLNNTITGLNYVSAVDKLKDGMEGKNFDKIADGLKEIDDLTKKMDPAPKTEKPTDENDEITIRLNASEDLIKEMDPAPKTEMPTDANTPSADTKDVATPASEKTPSKQAPAPQKGSV